MKGISCIYFGYQNPKFGLSITGFNTVILVDGDKICTLQGEAARKCRKLASEATAHLCGVTYSPSIAEIQSKVENQENDYPVYNCIFESFWDINTVQEKESE